MQPNQQSEPQELGPACAHALMEMAPRLKGAVHSFFQQRALGGPPSSSQFFFLCAISLLDCHSPSQLARKLHVTRPATTALADVLVARGLVERREDSRDRRQVGLYTTPAGHELVRRSMGLLEIHIGAYISRLDVAKQARLLEALKDLSWALAQEGKASHRGP